MLLFFSYICYAVHGLNDMNSDIATLENIANTLKAEPLANQRTLAKNADMSVGLMNAVLKRFVERGWIMFTHVTKQKFSYAITPQGLAELTERGKNFALRTFRIANTYNEAVLQLVSSAKQAGKTKVILYGESYVKFLLEYACKEASLPLEEKEDVGENPCAEKSALFVLGENLSGEDSARLLSLGAVSLLDVLYQKESEMAI